MRRINYYIAMALICMVICCGKAEFTDVVSKDVTKAIKYSSTCAYTAYVFYEEKMEWKTRPRGLIKVEYSNPDLKIDLKLINSKIKNYLFEKRGNCKHKILTAYTFTEFSDFVLLEVISDCVFFVGFIPSSSEFYFLRDDFEGQLISNFNNMMNENTELQKFDPICKAILFCTLKEDDGRLSVITSERDLLIDNIPTNISLLDNIITSPVLFYYGISEDSTTMNLIDQIYEKIDYDNSFRSEQMVYIGAELADKGIILAPPTLTQADDWDTVTFIGSSKKWEITRYQVIFDKQGNVIKSDREVLIPGLDFPML